MWHEWDTIIFSCEVRELFWISIQLYINLPALLTALIKTKEYSKSITLSLPFLLYVNYLQNSQYLYATDIALTSGNIVCVCQMEPVPISNNFEQYCFCVMITY